MRRPDYQDVRYGTCEKQKLDIYVPGKFPEKDGEKLPVIVLIHGGGFYCCDKRDFHIRPAEIFLEMGFGVVSVNYRMAPEFPFPFPGKDVCEAIRWVRNHGADYGLDGEKLFLHGTSAGGNLAAMNGLKAAGEKIVRGMALCCPVICLDTWKEELLQLESVPEENVEEVEKILRQYLKCGKKVEANGDFYIGAAGDYRIPVFLQHGDRDRLVSIRQSEEFLKKLQRAGWTELELDVLSGADHAGAGEEFFERSAVERIGRFFQKYL